MAMRQAHLLGLAVLALGVASCERANRTAAGPPDPLFLNAASQDRALFLTWSSAPGAGAVTLYWRRLGDAAWQRRAGDAHGASLIDGLVNGVTYECYATRALTSGETISSRPITQVPRARQFDLGRYVASQQTADALVRAKGIDPRSLRLVGAGAGAPAWGPSTPDGMYVNTEQRVTLFLLRYADDVFRPPAVPRPPDEVRRVLTRALWPTINPFDQPERFAMPMTPIDPPLLGTVRGYASAESFSIAYHPRLSSRCTRFVPAAPAPGKVAIYLDGHEGLTAKTGAATIERLLARGWQVIAVDMPLIGANRADRTQTLRNHYGFHWWPVDEVSPVSLFLQPLKALVDRIYREHGSAADLTVMLIGRSGGGWASYMYGALDPRVHYVVSIAGGMPMSLWLRDYTGKLGDYEQIEPRIYESVLYEDIMPAAGSRGAFYGFNEHDPCCFRARPGEPFVRYLEAAGSAFDKPVGVYVDTENRTHSFSPAAFAAMEKFLAMTETAARR
jgi:hypothetical protein